MKFFIQITALIVLAASSGISAKEFSGVWSTECGPNNNNPKTLWVISATSEGLYQVGHPRLQMSKPTPIVGTKEFKIINKDTIIYKNITYKHCSKSEIPKYNSVSEEQIKKYLQGEWKLAYQTIGGRKNNISNGRSGVPDLNFIDQEQATLNLKNNIQPIEYKVDADKIILKLNEWKAYKVLLVDQNELQLTFEMNPAKGVFIYYKTKKK